MVKTGQDEIIYENEIEALFYQYCSDNGIDTSLRKINDNDAYNIWEYIYNILFKPDTNTIRLNNKRSKLDYSDIESIYEILNIYTSLCFRFKILPLIEDFCKLTGISRDTLNSWERGEYRGGGDEKATFKHSDVAKKIRDATKLMGIKDQHGNPTGQLVLANNWDEMGLNFAQQQAKAIAEAWRPQQKPEEIAQRYAAYAEIGVNDNT